MKSKRFYAAKSPIYGVTVYDRTTQTPAYEYGAAYDMNDVSAAMLAIRLNIADRKGKLDQELLNTK